MNTLLYIGGVLGALAAIWGTIRLIGKWFGRVVSELVEQTDVFKAMTKQQSLIYRATLRIERRQLEDRKNYIKINGS